MVKPQMTRKSHIIFDFLDANRDGTLTWADMMTFPKHLKNAGKEELATRLETVYRGVYERINEAAGKPKTAESFTREEFVKGADIVRETDWFRETFVKETTDIYFDSIDRDSDNAISLKEWRAFYAARAVVDDKFTQETFEKLDASGNGTVSREEFKKAFAEFSVSEDNDNDFSFLYNINKIAN